MALVCDNIGFCHASGPGIGNVSLNLEPGQVMGVCGATGSGKSTLLACLAGELVPQRGDVRADGLPLPPVDAPPGEKRAYRGCVALAGQFPERQLFARTAFEDVLFGPVNAGLPADEARLCATEALEAVALDVDEAQEKSPFAYSGGEQRRLALAGMLALRPAYLLLDEPTCGLDPGQSARVAEAIKRVAADGTGVLLASHDLELLARLCGEVIVIQEGRPVASGPAGKVLSQASTLRMAGLEPTAAALLSGRLRGRGMELSPAATPDAFAANVAAALRRRGRGAV